MKNKARRKRFEKMLRIKKNNIPKARRGFTLTQKIADVNYKLIERNKEIIREREKVSNKVHAMGTTQPQEDNSDRA